VRSRRCRRTALRPAGRVRRGHGGCHGRRLSERLARARGGRAPLRRCFNDPVRIAGWIVVLILSVAAVLTLNPDWIGVLVPPWAELSTRFPISQAIAVRALPAGAFVLVGVIILIVALVRKIGFRGGNRTLALALVLVLVGVGHAGYLWTRGLENPAELGPDRGLRPTEEGDGAITLLTYNTAGGRTTSEEVANLAEQSGADVLVLPEAGPEFAEQTSSFLASADET